MAVEPFDRFSRRKPLPNDEFSKLPFLIKLMAEAGLVANKKEAEKPVRVRI
jgi:hypothetical protein